MTKSELIESVARGSGFTKNDTGKVINLVLDTIKMEILRSGKVVLTDFGTFKVIQRAAHTGRNPHNGEPVAIPAKEQVKFKASKASFGEMA